jgi:hypothetical protein
MQDSSASDVRSSTDKRSANSKDGKSLKAPRLSEASSASTSLNKAPPMITIIRGGNDSALSAANSEADTQSSYVQADDVKSLRQMHGNTFHIFRTAYLVQQLCKAMSVPVEIEWAAFETLHSLAIAVKSEPTATTGSVDDGGSIGSCVSRGDKRSVRDSITGNGEDKEMNKEKENRKEGRGRRDSRDEGGGVGSVMRSRDRSRERSGRRSRSRDRNYDGSGGRDRERGTGGNGNDGNNNKKKKSSRSSERNRRDSSGVGGSGGAGGGSNRRVSIIDGSAQAVGCPVSATGSLWTQAEAPAVVIACVVVAAKVTFIIRYLYYNCNDCMKYYNGVFVNGYTNINVILMTNI